MLAVVLNDDIYCRRENVCYYEKKQGTSYDIVKASERREGAD